MDKDDKKLGDKISDGIAKFGGSWAFIGSFSLFLFIWIVLNTLALFQVISWDQPPFILLNLILSFIAAFQAPFIMMSQNRGEIKQDESYRKLFAEIKSLIELDISIDQAHGNSSAKMLKIIKDLKKDVEIIKEKF